MAWSDQARQASIAARQAGGVAGSASSIVFSDADRAALAAMRAANGGKPLKASIALGLLGMIRQHKFDTPAHQSGVNAMPRSM